MIEQGAANKLTIGACVDRGGIAGLEVLLRSLVSAHSPETRLQIHVLHGNLPHRSLARLTATVEGRCASRITWSAFSPERYVKGRVVFGLMAYGRMFLPEIVETGRLLYLDTDVVVLRSVEGCAGIELRTCIAAVPDKTFGQSNCKDVFSRAGANQNATYFNTGVLIIDCDRWISELTRHHLIDFANRIRWDCPSGDQTLLNFHFNGTFDPLSSDWNRLAYSTGVPINHLGTSTRIVHFLGRPKPWECGGRINRQYVL